MGFLQDNGFDPATIDAEAILRDFMKDMALGLRGEPEGLPMLPAGFTLTGDVPHDVEFPAFDVGGTNIRSARVRFDSQGRPRVLNQLRGFMPGSRGPVDRETFYRVLCDVLAPNIRPGETLGYCFSYPVDAQGRLMFWTKGIQAQSIIGTDVRAGLADALAARGIPGCKIHVLNDTVAALLAAMAHQGSAERAGCVGFILGTGSNTAYAERGANVPKCPDLPPQAFVPINCESGNFLRFPRSLFDVRYESVSGNGHGVWERCISGVNLGALGTLILHGAAEEGLFSPGLRANLLSRSFTNIELDDFCAGRRPEIIYCSADEARALRGLLLPLYERAAIFSAINIAAAALAAAHARGCREGVVRVNADGSTFWKTACVPFVDIVRETLGKLLRPRGLDFELLRIDDAPLVGAALAAAH